MQKNAGKKKEQKREEKCRNLPTLGASEIAYSSINVFSTGYYENFIFFLLLYHVLVLVINIEHIDIVNKIGYFLI